MKKLKALGDPNGIAKNTLEEFPEIVDVSQSGNH